MTFSIFLKSFLFGLLINILFFLIDFFWISSLPKLNISYGSIRPPLAMFTVLRIGIFFLWIVFHIGYCIKAGNQSPICRWLFVISNILLLFWGLYSFYIEPFRLTTSKFEVHVQNLKRPVRIVQLSDLHVERMTPREQALPDFVNELNPDLIVITGDFLNQSYGGSLVAITPLRELISQFDAKMGIYGVNGFYSPDRIKEIFSGIDIRILDNDLLYIPEISENFVIIGLSFDEPDSDGIILENLMKQVRKDEFSLLLYHSPELAYIARNEKIDLYLAGHTHGGQVRLPIYGAIFTNSRYGKEFEMGLYQLDETKIFVSRGLGFTGGVAPRMRFLAPPEVVVIDLIPSK